MKRNVPKKRTDRTEKNPAQENVKMEEDRESMRGKVR